MSEVIAKVKDVLAKKLKVDEVDPNSELKNLGLDSLDIVELLLDLEDKFNVEFTSNELKSLKKVSDLYEAIRNKLKK